MNASTVITLKGVLALLLSILMGGCSVEIPDFNKVEFPCLEDSDCADGYECARSGEADGICIESGTTPVPVDCGPLTAPEVGEVLITATTRVVRPPLHAMRRVISRRREYCSRLNENGAEAVRRSRL